MIRGIASVIAGYASWTVLWLVGNSLLFAQVRQAAAAGERYEQAGPLLGMIGLSIACSVVAGFICAALSGGRARVLIITGLLLLVTGIGVQASVWSLMPVWYHAVFLVLVLPGVLLGSTLVPRRAG